MQITFINKRVKKLAESNKELTQKFGDRVSKSIQMKIRQLEAFANLNDVPTHPPHNRHKLNGKYKNCFAIDAIGRKDSIRIVFEPVDREGNVIYTEKLTEITCIKIVFIGDYHK